MLMDINTLRHSCSHIMAAAVKQLWPDAKLGKLLKRLKSKLIPVEPAIVPGFPVPVGEPRPVAEAETCSFPFYSRV